MNICITGCSSGIGAATASHLIRTTNAVVIGIARRADQLKKLHQNFQTDEERKRFYPIVFDLNDMNNYTELVENITQCAGNIDVLINNAGTLIHKSFEQISLDDYGSVMKLNVKAPFFLIQKMLPYFNKPAHIVNISSMGGFQDSVKFSGLSLYSASKAAIANLTQSLAVELEDRQISVNALAPGAVQTQMLEQAFPNYKAQMSPEEIAEFISFFALNGNKVFNGKILPIAISNP